MNFRSDTKPDADMVGRVFNVAMDPLKLLPQGSSLCVGMRYLGGGSRRKRELCF